MRSPWPRVTLERLRGTQRRGENRKRPITQWEPPIEKQVEKLQSRVNDLRMRYAQLSFDSDGIRRKIEKAKQAQIF